MCLNPSYIKNRKYLPNKKNGGVVPPVSDMRVLYVPVGCGVCIECKKQKSRQWQIRLKEDIKRYKNPVLSTLYSTVSFVVIVPLLTATPPPIIMK